MQLLLAQDTAERARLTVELRGKIVPAVDAGIVALRQLHASDPPVERARVERVAAGWADFERLWLSGALTPDGPAKTRASTRRVVAILEPVTTLAAEMAGIEVQHARAAQQRAEATYRAGRSCITAITAGSALVWLVIAVALARNIVPRVRAYSRFAAGVADGQLGGQLAAKGSDELAELGRTLDEMVRRGERQRGYQETQAEFADAMQLSETESEAHELLKRHLQRSISGSRVTVLNRNNSADRWRP